MPKYRKPRPDGYQPKPLNICPTCGSGHRNATYCSRDCAAKDRTEKAGTPHKIGCTCNGCRGKVVIDY